MTTSEILSVAGAVLASFGGATVVLIALTGWLGKVWFARLVENEKAELAKLHEEFRISLQELSKEREDALNRKRDVYSVMVSSMRVFLKGSAGPDHEKDKRTFLEAYATGYLWAAEPVVVAVRDFIQILEQKTAVDTRLRNAPADANLRSESSRLDREAKDSYQQCMLEMRRDCGFKDSMAEHRVVTFD